MHEAAGKQVPSDPLAKLLVDITLRCVSCVNWIASEEGDAGALSVVATFLFQSLTLAVRDDLAESPKPSRIRCRLTTIFAAEGAVERLGRTLEAYA